MGKDWRRSATRQDHDGLQFRFLLLRKVILNTHSFSIEDSGSNRNL